MGSPVLTFDMIPEITAVTSNPAAGVISVDVKTFTGRGRVSYAYVTCLADATVATRVLYASKISGALTTYLAVGATFTATTTGLVNAARGWAGLQTAAYPALADVEFAPGDILRVYVENGQAGDNMGAITYSYKETPI